MVNNGVEGPLYLSTVVNNGVEGRAEIVVPSCGPDKSRSKAVQWHNLPTFFSRAKEESDLRSAFQRLTLTTERQPELVVMTGASGSGKQL